MNSFRQSNKVGNGHALQLYFEDPDAHAPPMGTNFRLRTSYWWHGYLRSLHRPCVLIELWNQLRIFASISPEANFLRAMPLIFVLPHPPFAADTLRLHGTRETPHIASELLTCLT